MAGKVRVVRVTVWGRRCNCSPRTVKVHKWLHIVRNGVRDTGKNVCIPFGFDEVGSVLINSKLPISYM